MFTEKIQLESDETILILVRKHWFILALQFTGVVMTAILPIVLYIGTEFLPVSVTEMFSITIETSLLVGLYSAWLILCWMACFGIWTNYYLDVWTVTNKRLITVDQRGLFFRDTGSFRLERLQDINVSVRGILATFLKYGDLEAETASSDKNFIARGIPDPQELKALILKAADSITFVQQPQTNAPTVTAPQHMNDGL
jgi:uncharacterized membrane protein YdbT with pleckstrin-like domain